SVGIDKREERKTRVFAAEFLKDFVPAGILQIFLGLAFLHDEVNEHEIFFQDGLDFWGLDKLIESLAPPSPRRAENDEQIFLFDGGFAFRFGQKLVGGRRSLRDSREGGEANS